MTTGYEVSSSYAAGLAKAARTLGHFESVLAAIGAEGKAMLEDPMAKRWWDGEGHAQLIGTLHRLGGDASVAELVHETLRGSVSAIVMPLVKVTIAITGSTPASLLSRSSQFLSTSLRGVETEWTPLSPTSGGFTVRYPSPVPGGYLSVWKGMMAYVFELTRVHGEVGEASAGVDGQSFRYLVRWT